MGLLSDDDINRIEQALIAAGKDEAYRTEFLNGFQLGWNYPKSVPLDFSDPVLKGVERIPERLQNIQMIRPMFVGKDIGVLIGLFHYRTADILKEGIVNHLIPPVHALFGDGRQLFLLYIRHIMWRWEVEVLKLIRNEQLTGRQKEIFDRYRTTLCLR
jgi:hypothetical protein